MKMFICSQRVKVSAALDGKRLFLSLQSSVLDPQSSILDPQSPILSLQSSVFNPQPSVLGPKLELELARGLFSIWRRVHRRPW